MRVLIVDHDPAVLDAAGRALAGLIDSVQVTTKSECLARLRAGGIDIVVACERLADGSGLDLLATLGMNDPDVLRIFAADADRLKKLGGHLTPFKLFDTIGYPLDSLQLRSAMALAIAQRGDLLSGEFENIVLGGDETVPAEDTADLPAIDTLPQIVLLTRDSASLEAAGAALPDRMYRVIAARDAGEARADLVARQPVLALVDVGALGMDPVNWFVEANRASPATLLIALGRRNDGQALEPLVASGVLNRFVAKPVTQSGMRLVLESALRLQALNAARATPVAPAPVARFDEDLDELDGLRGPAVAGDPDSLATVDWQPPGVGRAAARPSKPVRRLRTGSRSRSLMIPAVLGGAALLALGGGWLYFSRTGTPTSPPSVAAAPTATAPEALPDGEALAARIEAALTRDDVADARAALGELQSTDPQHLRLGVLATLVARAEETQRLARTPVPRPPAAPASAPPPSSEPEPEPAPAPMAAPADAAADPSAEMLPEPAADPQPTTLAATPRPTAEPTDLRPSKITPVSFAGRTVEDSAAPPESAPPEVPAPIPQARPDRPKPVIMDMKLLRSVAPDYPEDARRRKIEGSVELTYIVGSDGRVRDVEVASSNPPGLFDAEAVAAVKRWRYDARREDGIPVEHPARVRLEFKLDD
ncbi:MAG TPA: TonB family protein [Steroidobacteraceae bacterium]|nr:TonB family protein [Steroidobacteraceae bacterium]